MGKKTAVLYCLLGIGILSCKEGFKIGQFLLLRQRYSSNPVLSWFQIVREFISIVPCRLPEARLVTFLYDHRVSQRSGMELLFFRSRNLHTFCELVELGRRGKTTCVKPTAQARTLNPKSTYTRNPRLSTLSPVDLKAQTPNSTPKLLIYEPSNLNP